MTRSMRRPFKICAIVTLAVALTYSGVAWAVDNCLRKEGHSHDLAMKNEHHREHGHDHTTPGNQQRSEEPSAPIIHCTPLLGHPGPGRIVAPVNGVSFAKAIPLDATPVPEAVSGDNFRLNSFFRKVPVFSLSFDRTRHLFLSVLQI